MPRRHKIDSAHTHCSFPENLMCSLSLSVLMTPLRIHAASSKEQTTLVSISTFSTSFVNFVFSLSEGVSNRMASKAHRSLEGRLQENWSDHNPIPAAIQDNLGISIYLLRNIIPTGAWGKRNVKGFPSLVPVGTVDVDSQLLVEAGDYSQGVLARYSN
ncbi:hypothetical protein An07g01500 [Aspergillus niger]|uniref:Uncharacterized protein n=2 Tax=Aspergillus niger TaxID=5061 RepID=A2QMB4_ASPNC|nr:hypothetical protein An07g01500 [Aspergillus niger]CAK96595.1 hypothetical protein An07g01500 [Aspergillus niger]